MRSKTGLREWDGVTYDAVSTPLADMGLAVLDRLPLEGNETVIDAGCGTGRITKHLVEMLPSGRVIAVDGSESMLELARNVLRPQDSAVLADLTKLELDEPVDAVFSTATFHWVLDHEQLFQRLFAMLRPGGRLVSQFGGQGNIATLEQAADEVMREPPFKEYFVEWTWQRNFPAVDDTAILLKRLGFCEVNCWIERLEVQPENPIDYMRTICLSAYVEQLPSAIAQSFVEEVFGRLDSSLTIDYVRLNVDARRPSGT